MISIRPLKPEEWQTFQKLNNEVFEDNSAFDSDLIIDWAFTEPGIKYYQEALNDQNCITFVAEDNGEAVGYLALAPKDLSFRKHNYIEIDNMGVSPTHRGKGVGTLLIAKAKEWAKEKGYTRIFVTSYSDNESAIGF